MSIQLEINGRTYTAELNRCGEVLLYDDEDNPADGLTYALIDEWELAQELAEPPETAPALSVRWPS